MKEYERIGKRHACLLKEVVLFSKHPTILLVQPTVYSKVQWLCLVRLTDQAAGFTFQAGW